VTRAASSPAAPPENSDSAAETVSALRDRATDARQWATTLRGAAAEPAEILNHFLTRWRERTYPAEPNSIRQARDAVAELAAAAGVTGQRLDAIRLAVSEAASNAVTHAYPDGDGGFRLRAAVTHRFLTVYISDEGCGPHIPSRHRGLGFGLAIIAASSDLFTIRQRKLGGTDVAMRWKIDPTTPPLGQDR
jgi:serine/threonine-protein kinase RsbW/stage II sporulation protein AB (anti-sigma F factor)